MPAFSRAAYSFAPKDAAPEVAARADYVCEKKGEKALSVKSARRSSRPRGFGMASWKGIW
ncbi:hypothetical protein M5E89_04450 [Acidaminococcus intestini]|nr:hypothetical protein M5E89_04450 [Acidaminococcus intestini]